MRYTSQFLNQLRSRLLPSQVVGKNVKLRPKGRGEFLGLCPFHQEKTPSFTVSDDKGFYHCFGCGAHGDIIKYVMETERWNYSDAVKRLAETAGLRITEDTYHKDNMSRQERDRTVALYDVVEEACQFFQMQLHISTAEKAKQYLVNRKITNQTIEHFRLGFAPDHGQALQKYLAEKGFSNDVMLEAGIISKGERGDFYPRFRNRIIFPICDRKGRVVAFGGRILDGKHAKYLNSPETPLFKKGDLLYAFHWSRKAAVDTNTLVVTEGYMDVIALHQAGIKNAVAPLGTALTESQLRLLWQIVKEPILCLDGDAAGKRAMSRAAELSLPLLQPGYSLCFASLPEGQDPDDVIKESGVAAMNAVLEKAKPLSEALWEMELAREIIKGPEGVADLDHRLLNIAQQIQHRSVSRLFQDFFRSRIYDLKDQLWKKNKQSYKASSNDKQSFRSSTECSDGVKISATAEINDTLQIESIILSLILHYPELLNHPDIEEEFSCFEFERDDYNKIGQLIVEIKATSSSEEALTKESLRNALEKSDLDDHIHTLEGKKDLLLRNTDSLVQEDGLKKLCWSYLIDQYQLAKMELESKGAVQQMEENPMQTSWDRVTELKKEIESLQQQIEEKKSLLEQEYENS